jgi:RNA polymerase sigma-70 factor (ECF subfamily)
LTRPAALDPGRRAELLAEAQALRPELHRYCARLMGSVIEGEDVVQDALVRALAALDRLDEAPPLRPRLFRIAHNRALDLLRGRTLRRTEPIDAAFEVPDPESPDPEAALLRREAVGSAVSRFAELPVGQRSVVILKDVMGEPLLDIAGLLDLSVDAVKGQLARGRARLREVNARPSPPPAVRPASPEVARYVALFNRGDWDGLRALLADDVRLHQSLHPLREGRADVGLFFSIYANLPQVRLAPAWLGDREVIAAFDGRGARPASLMWLEWRNGRIRLIRDTRYLPYFLADAELVLPPGASPAAP